MQHLQYALTSMLERQEPYPALVLDWDWNIVMSNQGYQRFSAQIKSMRPEFVESVNIMEMLFDPNGLRPLIRNWEEVASVTIQRLHQEKMVNPDRHIKLLEKLFSYQDWRQINLQQQPNPMVYVDFELAGIKIKFFSTLTSFGTPIDITAQELVIEQYYPADDATRIMFEGK